MSRSDIAHRPLGVNLAFGTLACHSPGPPRKGNVDARIAHEPRRGWRAWLPVVSLAFVAGAAMLGVATVYSSWGWVTLVGAPIVVGLILGLGLETTRHLLVLIGVLVVAGLLVSAVTLELAGVLCTLILACLVFLPALLALAIGRYMRRQLSRKSSTRGLWLLFIAVPLAIWLEARATPVMALERITTQRTISLSPDHTWSRLTFYEGVRLPRPALARIGLPTPRFVKGTASGLGERIRCVYESGYLTKRISGFEPGRRLEFDVIEQRGIEDRAVELISGSFELRPSPRQGTELKLTTVYRPLLQARSLWRPFERRVTRALHNHVLNGIEAASASSSKLILVARAEPQ